MAPVSDIFTCSLICMFMIISSLWFLQSVLNLICQLLCQLSFEKEKENDSRSRRSLTMSSLTSFVRKEIWILKKRPKLEANIIKHWHSVKTESCVLLAWKNRCSEHLWKLSVVARSPQKQQAPVILLSPPWVSLPPYRHLEGNECIWTWLLMKGEGTKDKVKSSKWRETKDKTR